MIVVDTTVLVYAVGADHPLREPCRAVVRAVQAGRVGAITTPEVIQELAHVRGRRRDRADAAELARSYGELLAPLTVVDADDLRAGLDLFDDNPRLGSFDAILAAAALRRGGKGPGLGRSGLRNGRRPGLPRPRIGRLRGEPRRAAGCRRMICGHRRPRRPWGALPAGPQHLVARLGGPGPFRNSLADGEAGALPPPATRQASVRGRGPTRGVRSGATGPLTHRLHACVTAAQRAQTPS